MARFGMRGTMLGVIGAALAASQAASSERVLDAHQHGHGVLNIAIEGETLWIELEAPGADIVGFEHPASSDKDKAAIAAAKAALGDPVALFGIPAAASCALDNAAVTLVGDEPEGHGAHHDDHDDHHVNHSDHGDHDDDHAEEEAHHTEFHAEYKLRCADATELGTLPLHYFTIFSAAAELDVSIITDDGQRRQEASRAAPTVRLRGD